MLERPDSGVRLRISRLYRDKALLKRHFKGGVDQAACIRRVFQAGDQKVKIGFAQSSRNGASYDPFVLLLRQHLLPPGGEMKP